MSKTPKPQIKKPDVHIIVNDFESQGRYVGEAVCYLSSGKVKFRIPALAKGVNGPGFGKHGDTPPGLYKLGELTETQKWEGPATWNAYGRYFIDMVELHDQEVSRGRAGIGIHGGGSAAPNPLAPIQLLLPTLGCIRIANKHLEELLVPTYAEVKDLGGVCWLTVNQW